MFQLWVDNTPYSQIKTGDEELHGIFRFTDEHLVENNVKKSIFKVVVVEPGMDNEEVPIEVSFNIVRKAAMIAVKSTSGEKHQRSEVVKGKKIHDAFPINMLEVNRSWKLTAKLPNNLASKRHFELFINQKSFYKYDFVPQTQKDSKTLRGIITLNESLFLGEE